MGKKPAVERYGRKEIQYHNGVKVTYTVLDTLEEYEANVEELDEYSFTYLSNNPNYSTVYTVNALDLELYSDLRMKEFRVCPSVASVVSRLRMGFHYGNIDPKTVHMIPIMEYKLVPTGNVYYFDPTLDPEVEKVERRKWRDRRNKAVERQKKREAKLLAERESKK